MKKITFLLLISGALFISSCSKDFLTESSLDLVRPTTTQSLNQLLTGEAYPTDASLGAFHSYLDIITDDIQANFTNDALYITRYNLYAPAYTWQPDMLDQLQQLGAVGYQTYYNYYQKIKGCNVVLDNVDIVSGTQAEKQNIKGQALALRAYFYFTLANIFGKPYNHSATNIDTDLGVPLILTAAVTSDPIKRATLKTMYDQIEKDLLEAISLLPDMNTTNSVYRFTNTSAALFASRFYLFKNDWDNSIKYADMAIAKAPALKDLNTVTTTTFAMLNPLLAGTEVIFAFGTAADFSVIGSSPNSNGKAPFSLADDLINLYDATDLRKTLYMAQSLYITTTLNVYYGTSAKFTGSNSAKAFRTSEAYLNRAEAYIQKGLKGDGSSIQKALTDINDLRRRRIKTASYQDIATTDPTQLFAIYKNERRKELFMEDHRWFDLRRWGMPAITHKFQVDATPQTATLKEADSRYTLRFSQDILSRNPNLTQNP